MTAGLARRKERTEQRRERILDIALECFLARGYAATSMSEMAARLGGSKCTLYRHFKSKDEVFETTVHRQCLATGPATAFGGCPSSSTRRTISARLHGVVRAFLCRFIRSPETR